MGSTHLTPGARGWRGRSRSLTCAPARWLERLRRHGVLPAFHSDRCRKRKSKHGGRSGVSGHQRKIPSGTHLFASPAA